MLSFSNEYNALIIIDLIHGFNTQAYLMQSLPLLTWLKRCEDLLFFK